MSDVVGTSREESTRLSYGKRKTSHPLQSSSRSRTPAGTCRAWSGRRDFALAQRFVFLFHFRSTLPLLGTWQELLRERDPWHY